MVYNDIKSVIPQFRFQGKYLNAYEITSGNVNNTFRLEYSFSGKPIVYTLQHINRYVFKNPVEVVQNIVSVTDHIRSRILMQNEDPGRRVLEMIPTTQGDYILEDQHGEYWRAYTYILNANALDLVETPEQMEEVGRGFGSFQKLLTDFDVNALYNTIPNFHHTTKRFYQFVRALDEDRVGRADSVEEEIEFMFEHRQMMGSIVKLLEQGTIPYRVTHNDTKANNVLLDAATGKALCVIDLDTVMPGSVLYDYGDAIRFGASTAAEDEADTSLIRIDMDKTRAFTRGFVNETNGFLTEAELIRLPLGIKVMTCELAMRFLTDYIDGDLYFKLKSPEHNLTRARAQIALFKEFEAHESEIQDMIQEFIQVP